MKRNSFRLLLVSIREQIMARRCVCVCACNKLSLMFILPTGKQVKCIDLSFQWIHFACEQRQLPCDIIIRFDVLVILTDVGRYRSRSWKTSRSFCLTLVHEHRFVRINEYRIVSTTRELSSLIKGIQRGNIFNMDVSMTELGLLSMSNNHMENDACQTHVYSFIDRRVQ
jgi:hypothetical protein